MPDTVRTLIETLAQSAEKLGDERAQELVDGIRSHWSAPKLQILVVGSSGAGRCSLVDVILDRPALLPRTPVPKAPLPITVKFGPSETAQAVATGGAPSAVPVDKLRTLLAPVATNSYQSVAVQAPCELLKTSDLRIEALEADRSPQQWADLLATTDFVILVLNATALLSERERRFVRDHLAGPFGLARVAIIVNQMDLAAGEEASLLDLVRTFLGPFESQPAVLGFSAKRTLESLASDESPADGGKQAVSILLHDVFEGQASLRLQALQQELESAVSEVESAGARRQALLSMDRTEIEQMRDRISARHGLLEERIARVQHRVAAFVGTIIKEDVLAEIAGFGEVLRHRLPEEIASIDDVALARRHLPGYIESVWRDFLIRQALAINSRLAEEMRRVAELIARDLEDLIEQEADIDADNVDFDAGLGPLHTLVMPRRGKHFAGSIAKGLSLQGLMLIPFVPMFGALSLSAGYIVRRIYRGGLAEADREALTTAAVLATREVERQRRERVDEEFKTLSDQLQEQVAAAYRDGMTTAEGLLEEYEKHLDERDARRAEIDVVMRQTIPELRRLLAELSPQNVTA